MLIIYDTTGKIIMTSSEDAPGVQCITADVPAGYTVESVDVSTGEPVLTPIPATEEERMAAIEKSYQAAAGTHAGSYTDPIPFVYGMAVKNGLYYRYDDQVWVWTAADVAACVWFPGSAPNEWQVAAEPVPEAAGTLDDPITAVSGMAYEEGKYYLDETDGLTYICTRSETLYYLPHELVGQYFELAAEV